MDDGLSGCTDDCPSVPVAPLFLFKHNLNYRDTWLDDGLSVCADDCAAVPVDSEDPLFLLYTSGSTGKPKVTQDLFLVLL